MIGYFSTEFGPLNQIIHMWGYENLEERARRRAKLMADEKWQAYTKTSRPMIRAQENKLLIPAPFSPAGGERPDRDATAEFGESQEQLRRLMEEKSELEYRYSSARLALQRKTMGYGPPVTDDEEALRETMTSTRVDLMTLDQKIAPMARAAGELVNPHWGPLLRTGNERSLLARQIEQSADVYTSRASNLLWVTPFEFLRSSRGTMPHDEG